MKGDMEVEVLKDTSEADQTRMARKRMQRMVMTADEQLQYACAPVTASLNDRPGYPCEGEYSD